MASSSAITFTLPNIGTGFHTKLEGPNYSAWMTQLVPVLKSHELMDFVDGSKPCPSKFIVDTHGELTSNISPEYLVWSRKDQFVLPYRKNFCLRLLVSNTPGTPVVKPSTIRVLLASAVQFDSVVRQLDVSSAFLHEHLLEEVYMEQPQGFVDAQFPGYVCRLHKSLYGLKQGPRAWYTRLSQALMELGFVSSSVDTSLFILHRGSDHIYFFIYVDDILVIGNNSYISEIISCLQLEFKLKDLGSLNYFLGIQASRSSVGALALASNPVCHAHTKHIEVDYHFIREKKWLIVISL